MNTFDYAIVSYPILIGAFVVLAVAVLRTKAVDLTLKIREITLGIITAEIFFAVYALGLGLSNRYEGELAVLGFVSYAFPVAVGMALLHQAVRKQNSGGALPAEATAAPPPATP